MRAKFPRNEIIKKLTVMFLTGIVLCSCVTYADEYDDSEEIEEIENIEDTEEIAIEDLSRSDEIIVETAPNEIVLDGDVKILSKDIRSVDIGIILDWAKNAHIASGEEILQAPCTWKDFMRFLWRSNGSPYVTNKITLEESEKQEEESILRWAVNAGLLGEKSGRKKLSQLMTHKDAQEILWLIAGKPEPSWKAHKLPIGSHDKSELWACDIGLIVREEQPTSNPSNQLAIGEGLSYIYYTYNRRVENSFPISVEEFLASCQHVVDTARTNGYVYGNSCAQNPTTDGIISCDRLIAKALYDLGYVDQPTGGITCGDADEYLSAWGFVRSTSIYDARRGSIMLVKHNGLDYTSHMFVMASDFNFNEMRADRYDCGSDYNIQSVQPLRGQGFWYRTDDIIVYNIPQ